MSNTYEPDVRKHEFRSTGIENYLTCPRKWYIENILRLESTHGRVAADFGGAIHEGIAAFYRGLSREEAIAAFAAAWHGNGDAKRTTAGGLLALDRYMTMYQGDQVNVRPEDVEIRFALSMPNGTTLTGTLDRIVREGNSLSFDDTKTTTSTLTDWFWSRYRNSFQLGAYDYAMTNLLGRCDFARIDAINVAPGPTAEQFQRKVFIRSDLQRSEWLNTYLRETDAMASAIPSSGEVNVELFPQRPVSCDKFGGCVFLGACQYGITHPSVAIDLTEKPPATHEE